MHSHYLILDWRPRVVYLQHPGWLWLCRAAPLDSGKRVPWFGQEMITIWRANGN